MQIKWTELALDDLESIRVYISKDSQFYARQFIERLFDSTEKLQDFPQLGRRIPDSISKSRLTLSASPCRIIHTVCGSPSCHF